MDLIELGKLGLTPSSYSILWNIAHNNLYDRFDPTCREDIDYLNKYLKVLEKGMWVKRLGNRVSLRDKSIKLNLKNDVEVDFSEFWDKYHYIVQEWKKQAKNAAIKHWDRLSNKEKVLALDNIEPWYNSLKIIGSGRASCMARTYLSEKRFNDELEPDNKNISNTEMI